MTLRLQIFLTFSTIVTIVIMIMLIKREALQIKYSLLWIILGVGLVLLSLFPKILFSASNILGIATPVNALFLIGLSFELMIIFSLTIALSRNSDRVKTLAQEVALLRKEVEDK